MSIEIPCTFDEIIFLKSVTVDYVKIRKFPIIFKEEKCKVVKCRVFANDTLLHEEEHLLVPGFQFIDITLKIPDEESGTLKIVFENYLDIEVPFRKKTGFESDKGIFIKHDNKIVGILKTVEDATLIYYPTKVYIKLAAAGCRNEAYTILRLLVNLAASEKYRIQILSFVSVKHEIFKCCYEDVCTEYFTTIYKPEERPYIFSSNVWAYLVGNTLIRYCYLKEAITLPDQITLILKAFGKEYPILLKIKRAVWENIVEKVEFEGYYKASPSCLPKIECKELYEKYTSPRAECIWPSNIIKFTYPINREGELVTLNVRLVPKYILLNCEKATPLKGPGYGVCRCEYCHVYDVDTLKIIDVNYGKVVVKEDEYIPAIVVDNNVIKKLYVGEIVDEINFTIQLRVGESKTFKVLVPIHYKDAALTTIVYDLYINDEYKGILLSHFKYPDVKNYAICEVVAEVVPTGKISDVHVYVAGIDVTEKPLKDFVHLMKITLSELSTKLKYKLIIRSRYGPGKVYYVWDSSKNDWVSDLVIEFTPSSEVERKQVYIYFTILDVVPGGFEVPEFIIELYAYWKGKWIKLDVKAWPCPEPHKICKLPRDKVEIVKEGEIKNVLTVLYKDVAYDKEVHVKYGDTVELNGYAQVIYKEPFKEYTFNVTLYEKRGYTISTLLNETINITRECYEKEDEHYRCHIEKETTTGKVIVDALTYGKKYTILYLTFKSIPIKITDEVIYYSEVNGVKSNEVKVIPSQIPTKLTLEKTEIIKGETVKTKITIGE